MAKKVKYMKSLISGILLSFSVCLNCFAQSSQTYLIKAGKIYDSENNIFVENQEILIQGDKIVSVGKDLAAHDSTVILDYSNSTITPGLIDAHTHMLTEQKVNGDLVDDVIKQSEETRLLRAVKFAKSYLEAGFTSTRDLGNSGQYLDVELRNAINKDYVVGPRMYVSGPIISSYDGQFGGLPFKEHEKLTKLEYRLVNGTDDARLAVKEHIVQSVDVIKILAFGNSLPLSLEEMKAIVETSHENRIKVTVHADRDWVVHNAIAAGVDGIEHGYNFKDSTFMVMAKKGIYFVPTYGSVEQAIHYYKTANLPYDLEEVKKGFQPTQERLRRAVELGVVIVAGSDAYFDLGITRGDNAKQTLLGYYEAGLKANDVLKTATFNASLALNRENQIGVIKENAFADIAVFEGDLETNFKESLFKVQLVIKEGKIQYENAFVKN
ncbi:amidohydrolase family protein [Catalinimonas niigatensis]|uniref:amidohydrolase family protein n=1 Tax=Catalinimonas niigatensis TaxID=1397264 RepID=UPI0026669217|nr:amidohydrolase family protein [Catalinimonas niigatensis]WPP51698.1 amidohydrolase family protein [Catalinimonas niigatensis]